MPGYDNRFKRLDFPDLGPDVYVTMRNAKTMAPSQLRPEGIPLGPDGNPLDDNEAERAMHAVLAKLVRDWHVYDATSDEDEQPLLGLPATDDDIRRLPLEILKKMTAELGAAANPS
jgi:hypothetical protein